jgi:acetylornithine deacetylase
MGLSVDESFVIETLQRLVRIDSTNPTLNARNAGEGEIAVVLAELAALVGLDVTVQEVLPGRPNVVGVLKGTARGRSLMFNGHTDTVGVEGMAEPFSAAIREGKLYGRGAQDMKASLAAMLGAAKAIVDAGITLGGDLIVAFVIDEETVSEGSADLVKRFSADAAIVTEPTNLSITRAHRGFIWFEVKTLGRAAHGSRYNEGIDANMHMGRFLAQLDKLEQELRARPPHPLVGPPSLHASLIKGGSEISTYAAHCLLTIERRTVPGETVASAMADLQAIIDGLAAEDASFRATVRPIFSREPFEVSQNAAIVQTLEHNVTKRLGQPPSHTGQTFWTDAALLASAGMETVLIGPTGAGLHSAEEWVDRQSVLDLAFILAGTAMDYCG